MSRDATETDGPPRRPADGWVDQNASPLGKAKHLSLAKSGKVPAFKDGKQVFIRRSVLDAWLASRLITFEIDSDADEQREAARFVAELGRRRR